jgi:hypothetical protein
MEPVPQLAVKLPETALGALRAVTDRMDGVVGQLGTWNGQGWLVTLAASSRAQAFPCVCCQPRSRGTSRVCKCPSWNAPTGRSSRDRRVGRLSRAARNTEQA